MPRKTFANGFPLPASDLNTYLMDQAVQTYADATARTAALATPVEGQMSYLADQNTAYVYDGSSWNAVVDAKNYGTTLPNGAAGRNKIINGGFDFWQRLAAGTTSVALSGSTSQFLADRFQIYRGVAGSTASQQTGSNGLGFALRIARDSGNTSTSNISVGHHLDSATSRELAGTTATLSFKARAGANLSSHVTITLASGTGTDQNLLISGYTGQSNLVDYNQTLTTSWVRYTYTFNVGSTANELGLIFRYTPVGTAGANDYFEIDEVQLESGSVATPFARAGGTVQGELAACQRYYYRTSLLALASQWYGMGLAVSTSIVYSGITFPVTMRVIPTSLDYSAVAVSSSSTLYTGGTLSFVSNSSNANFATVSYTHTSAALVTNQAYLAGLAANGYVGFNAEL